MLINQGWASGAGIHSQLEDIGFLQVKKKSFPKNKSPIETTIKTLA